MHSRPLSWQIVMFGAVGVAATLMHIAVAWTAFARFESHLLLANLLGAGAAFFISFLGNALITFRSHRPVTQSGPRYLVITLASYALTSAIMGVVESRGLPGHVYAALVLAVVPPGSFLLARLWVFAPDKPDARSPRAL